MPCYAASETIRSETGAYWARDSDDARARACDQAWTDDFSHGITVREVPCPDEVEADAVCAGCGEHLGECQCPAPPACPVCSRPQETLTLVRDDFYGGLRGTAFWQGDGWTGESSLADILGGAPAGSTYAVLCVCGHDHFRDQDLNDFPLIEIDWPCRVVIAKEE